MPGSSRRPDESKDCAGRPARPVRYASTPGSSWARRSAIDSTRCWPRSWSSEGIARRPSPGSTRRSTRRSSSASPRTCASCVGSSGSRASSTGLPGSTPSSGSGRRTAGSRPSNRRRRPGRPPHGCWPAASTAICRRGPGRSMRTTRGAAAGASTRGHRIRLETEGGLERSVEVPDEDRSATARDGPLGRRNGARRRGRSKRWVPGRAGAGRRSGRPCRQPHPEPGRPRSCRRCRDPCWPSTWPSARVVELGDPLVTLEAMKMEHVVVASGARDGSRGCGPAGRPGPPGPGPRNH